MSADFQSFSGKHPQELIKFLPLRAPLSLFIDPTNACNFQCSFCPTGNRELLKSVQRRVGSMDLDLFYKIIDDLADFESKLRRLHLYKDGEPFLHKKLCQMIAYAKQKKVSDSVETTTNGSLITDRNIPEIIESGLDVLRFSIEHVHDRGYGQVTRNFTDYGLIRKNVEAIYNEKIRRGSSLKIHTKIVDVDLTTAEKEKFNQDFSSICDTLYLDTIMGWSFSNLQDFTLGLNPAAGIDSSSPLKSSRIVCPEPFKTMAVNWNGLVSPCCVDWSMGALIGDVRDQSLRDIWTSRKLQRFRLLHLHHERSKVSVCAQCQYLEGLHPMSDLDDHRGELLTLYS